MEVVRTFVDLSDLYHAWQDLRRTNPALKSVVLDYNQLVRAAQNMVFGPSPEQPIWGVTTKIRPSAQAGFLRRLRNRGWELCVRNEQVSRHSTPLAAQLALASRDHPQERILCVTSGAQLDDVLALIASHPSITLAFFATSFETNHPQTLALDDLVPACCI